jgi:hypothetical protein
MFPQPRWGNKAQSGHPRGAEAIILKKNIIGKNIVPAALPGLLLLGWTGHSNAQETRPSPTATAIEAAQPESFIRVDRDVCSSGDARGTVKLHPIVASSGAKVRRSGAEWFATVEASAVSR